MKTQSFVSLAPGRCFQTCCRRSASASRGVGKNG